jgi:hypothetical protein
MFLMSVSLSTLTFPTSEHSKSIVFFASAFTLFSLVIVYFPLLNSFKIINKIATLIKNLLIAMIQDINSSIACTCCFDTTIRLDM